MVDFAWWGCDVHFALMRSPVVRNAALNLGFSMSRQTLPIHSPGASGTLPLLPTQSTGSTSYPCEATPRNRTLPDDPFRLTYVSLQPLCACMPLIVYGSVYSSTSHAMRMTTSCVASPAPSCHPGPAIRWGPTPAGADRCSALYSPPLGFLLSICGCSSSARLLLLESSRASCGLLATPAGGGQERCHKKPIAF